VQNWLNSGKSAGVVGEELGINANLLYAWVQFIGVVYQMHKYFSWDSGPVAPGSKRHPCAMPLSSEIPIRN